MYAPDGGTSSSFQTGDPQISGATVEIFVSGSLTPVFSPYLYVRLNRTASSLEGIVGKF